MRNKGAPSPHLFHNFAKKLALCEDCHITEMAIIPVWLHQSISCSLSDPLQGLLPKGNSVFSILNQAS